jgi:hypothetical protein
MSQFQGFSKQLQTPGDLLEKLRHDLKRLEDSPADVYAAFDFFVTAEHMLDWIYPNGPKRREQERKSNILLPICSHIANGAKHFQANYKHHQSVSAIVSQEGGFQPSAFQPSAFPVSTLVIQLDSQAAAELGTGPEIECLELARRVLKFWENHAGVK